MTVVGRVVAAGVIVAGSIALGGSAQAAAATVRADGQITSPSDGQVISNPSVTVAARTGVMQLNVGLYVQGPSTPSQKVAGGGANQSISGTFDAGGAPNGTFTVTLKGEITGTAYATSMFKLQRPPEVPGNVDATRQGTSKVLVTWSKGAEPDLQSYEVSNSQSGIVGRLPVDSACSGSSCRAALAVPTKAEGQKVGFTVKAFRGDGDGGSIGSGSSAAAYVAFPAAPKPKKTADARTPKTKDTKNVDPLPTLPAKKQTLPTSKPTTHKRPAAKLPAIPDTDPKGNLPIPTADETGGLTPTDTKNGTQSAPAQSVDAKAQSGESPIGNIGQYGVYVAAGILLLLVGAHAGAWARRRALAAVAAGGPASGTTAAAAAMPSAGGTQAKPGSDSVPAVTPPPRRRPAVILAVAKTRMPVPDRSQAQQPLSAERPDAAAAARTSSPTLDQKPTSSAALDQNRTSSAALDQKPTSSPVLDQKRAPSPLLDQTRTSSPALDHKRKEVPAVLPLSAEGEEARGGAEPRKEPVRIALPSSAVTDVRDSDAFPVRPAVRIEDRWDDYLPPSPRSMEDSGFWERPQPGSADFWAADEDNKESDEERAYAGRRHTDGES
ncbi:hypothetical protein [Nonomuraea sp. NPDC049695]|uniref:hypothetical protein n=1 Tax=Nonomuraea sp. NPDC049695 TaxID=3154734 RepID=UPI003432F079